MPLGGRPPALKAGAWFRWLHFFFGGGKQPRRFFFVGWAVRVSVLRVLECWVCRVDCFICWVDCVYVRDHCLCHICVFDDRCDADDAASGNTNNCGDISVDANVFFMLVASIV